MNRYAVLLPLVLFACDESGETAKPERPSEPAKSERGGEESKATVAPAASGPFAEFAQSINDASDAIEKAARGEKVDAYGIEPTSPPAADKLEDAKRLFAVVEMEATSDTQGYLRTNVLVYPDGAVRWVELTHKPGKVSVRATADLDEAAPALATSTKLLTDMLAGDGCKTLPIVDDLQKLPEQIRGEVKPVQPQLDAVCTAMKGKADGWQPRYDDMTVFLQAGETLVMVKSSVGVEGGKLKLSQPRVR